MNFFLTMNRSYRCRARATACKAARPPSSRGRQSVFATSNAAQCTLNDDACAARDRASCPRSARVLRSPPRASPRSATRHRARSCERTWYRPTMPVHPTSRRTPGRPTRRRTHLGPIHSCGGSAEARQRCALTTGSAHPLPFLVVPASGHSRSSTQSGRAGCFGQWDGRRQRHRPGA